MSDPGQFRRALLRLTHLTGIDRAIAYTLLARGWGALAGPVTIFLVARFLKPEEQGFYYTFGSVTALNIFFELGLTYVLLQFASHEKAHLEWTSEGTLTGSEVAHLRLAALLRFALRWYAVAASLALVIVLPAGLWFFTRNYGHKESVTWVAPWIWLITSSALNLLVAPVFAIIEGSGRISHIASMRVLQSMCANLALWLTLSLHGGLFAGPVFQTTNLTVELVWLSLNYRLLVKSLLAADISAAPFHWLREVWPFQWRIAISWLSGYFIFQLFNPVLFATHGPEVAGRMGMSITICNALMGASISWMTTKASPFGVLIAKKDWRSLDTVFLRAFLQSLSVLVIGAVFLFAIVLLLFRTHNSVSGRLLEPLPFAFLLGAVMMNHTVFCEAQYLRAHKAEPFLWLSVGIAVITISSTLLLAAPYSSTGVAVGYFGCSATAAVFGTRIFFQKRKQWH